MPLSPQVHFPQNRARASVRHLERRGLIYVDSAWILKTCLFLAVFGWSAIAAACSPAPSPTQTSAPAVVPTDTATLAPLATTNPIPSTAVTVPATTSLSTPISLPPFPSATTTPTRALQPTSTNAPIVLMEPPQLNLPGAHASYGYRSPVILTWTFDRPLAPDEYFEIQLSRQGTDPGDFGCTQAKTFEIVKPPMDYGWYQWRILVRRGTLQGDQCTPQADLSRPSEIRTFEWRMPPEQPSPYP